MTCRAKISAPAGAGYTLLEICLAMGLCVLFMGICIPLMGGWIAENQFRKQADALIETVQNSAREAEMAGKPVSVILADSDQRENKAALPGERVFFADSAYTWKIRRLGNASHDARIRISANGFVEPVSVRMERDGKWLEFRFDLLTAHATDETYSF